MKAQDVILQLMANLPAQSPFFSQQLAISSITKAGMVATVNTVIPHGLALNSLAGMARILTPVQIDTTTVISPTQIEVKTLTPHDLTLNQDSSFDRAQKVRLTGASFDEEYQLLSVINRYRFIIKPGVALPGGALYLQEYAIRGYNGLKLVTAVPTPNSFQFQLDFDLPQPNYLTNAIVATGFRISGAADFQTMVNSYTAQPVDNIWACVVLDDYVASKDRRTLNDSVTQQGKQMDFMQDVIASFTVYIIVPNKGDILTQTNGRAARDIIEDIRVPLFRSLLGADFGSGLCSPGQGVVAYTGDGFVSYNGAVYIHQFSFQQVIQITSGDTAIQTFDRAFRDIDLSIKNQFSDVTVYMAAINLDEQPEP